MLDVLHTSCMALVEGWLCTSPASFSFLELAVAFLDRFDGGKRQPVASGHVEQHLLELGVCSLVGMGSHPEGSVEAALEARSRKVEEVLIRSNKSRRDTTRLEHLARRDRVTVRRVEGAEIDALVSGKTHGGIIARVGERRLLELEKLLPADGPALVVMLDGVEDPFNFGYALRSLYAAGVSGVVVRQRDWTTAAGVVVEVVVAAAVVGVAVEWGPAVAVAVPPCRSRCSN